MARRSIWITKKQIKRWVITAIILIVIIILLVMAFTGDTEIETSSEQVDVGTEVAPAEAGESIEDITGKVVEEIVDEEEDERSIRADPRCEARVDLIRSEIGSLNRFLNNAKDNVENLEESLEEARARVEEAEDQLAEANLELEEAEEACE